MSKSLGRNCGTFVVEFGEPILIGTGLDKEARGELLSTMILIQETRPNTKPGSCKNSSTLKKKKEKKNVKTKSDDKYKPLL